MLEKLTETTSIWTFLRNQSKPVVLYGMGNGADMIIGILDEIGVEVKDIFASDEFVRGHYFHGFKVMKYSEICEKYDDFVVLMTFAVHDEKTMNYVRQMSREHTVLSPTVPVAGKGLFTLDYIKENEEKFDEAYSMLADEKSRSDFLDVLNFKVSGKLEYLFRCQSEKEELYSTVFRLREDEIIADLGAYDGDTIREFLSVTGGKYRKIYAVEPDSGNFKKLIKKTSGMADIELINKGAGSKTETLFFRKKSGRNSGIGEDGIPVPFDSLDNIVRGEVTFIKMDIEGNELEALDGAKNIIAKYKPKLYICAYHRNEDAFSIPFKIRSICPDYSIYYRHHPYIPAWESNFYCVCEKY